MSQNNPGSRLQQDFSSWVGGVDSYLSPLIQKQGIVRWAVNAVNKGGLWQTRPGFATRFTWPTPSGAVQLQGCDWFKPTNGNPYLVTAINGVVYAQKVNANGSLGDVFALANVAFSPNAKTVVFCRALQSQTIVNGVVVPRTARNVLIMQDGGSRACYWDGVTSGSLNPQKSVTVTAGGDTLFDAGYNETRIGLWMAWSGNRLIVSNGPQVFASDINDPLHFTEELNLLSVPVINIEGNVTGLSDRGTSGSANSQCLIMTQDATFAIITGVQQRAQDLTNGIPGWIGTPNFLSKIFAGTGCVAGKSIINHRGLIYWLSPGGIVEFDNINSVTSTQNMPAINTQMAYSNVQMSPDQSGCCAGAFNSYIFWSVSSGATASGTPVNSQTQVLDTQPIPETPETVYSWQGIWTGVRPVQWVTLEAYGQFRCYCLSLDVDGVPRTYEAFQANRADNGKQIPWLIETPLHLIQGTPLFGRANFLYARAFMENILGNLDMVWLWKGTRGKWHEILTTRVTATPGSILTPTPHYYPLKFETDTRNFIPQVRDIISRNVRGPQDDCNSSKVEARGLAPDESDRAFAMQFQFLGRGCLTGYRLAADNVPQNTEGAVTPPETGFHVLPGGGSACPEFIEGEVPDYTMQPENPAGAVIGFPTQEQTHFATSDLIAYQSSSPEFLQGQVLAWLLPCLGSAGVGLCSCPDSFSQQVTFTGSPGDYNVTIRIAGVSEGFSGYINGEQGNGWYVGGEAGPNPSGYNIYRLEISDPPQVFFLNPTGGMEARDFTNTIRVRAGATMRLSADSVDSVQVSNSTLLTVPNVPGIAQPYNGQFMSMQILETSLVT